MVILKSRDEIDKMKRVSQIVAEVMAHLASLIKPGVTTIELDKIAEEMIIGRKAKPAFKGYHGYRHTLCISVNEEVVHGIPGKRELVEGDIVGIDCGVFLNGFYGDHAQTLPVGQISLNAEKLLETTSKALDSGIKAACKENRLYDISAEIQQCAEQAGYSVVRDYVGHGIGRSLHEDPQVPNFGEKGTGMRLRPGLVLALEPMINEGTYEVQVLEDGWTVVTKDRKLSAHMEHTIAITEEGPEILSKL
ncbi:MAG: type I methionyl aminopeptidase [Pseudomonadota bacterium]